MLTPEELVVLKQCSRDAVYQRALPLGAITGLVTYFSKSKKFVHKKYGRTPIAVIASAFGYFAGKISYQVVCMQKLLDVPNGAYKEYYERYNLY